MGVCDASPRGASPWLEWLDHTAERGTGWLATCTADPTRFPCVSFQRTNGAGSLDERPSPGIVPAVLNVWARNPTEASRLAVVRPASSAESTSRTRLSDVVTPGQASGEWLAWSCAPGFLFFVWASARMAGLTGRSP